MGYSFIQDLKGGFNGYGEEEYMEEEEEEDMDSLMFKADMMVANIDKLNQTMEYMMNIENNCDMDHENDMDYYTFVMDDFYLPLIRADMMEMYTLWGSVEFGPPGPLEEFENYNDMGVPCMNDIQQRDLMAVQVVVKVYIEMVQLHLAVIREEMLETTGECPAGFELGDWSDDSGECCCDPSNQPEPPQTEDGEEPIEITFGGYGEEPIEINFGGYGDGEEPIEIPSGGDGEEPIEITSGGDGEEPIEIPFGDGEEPIEIGYGGGEEPVEIPSGDGEEPVEIPQGEGEEPIEITGGEEPVLIGGGEEPVSISSGEEPVSLGGGESPVTIGNGTTMLPSSTATGSRRRGRRNDHMSTTTVGPTGQSPISIPNGYGDGEEPVTVGYGDGEEPVTIGAGYGGEEPVTIGGGGEEPVTIGGGYGGEEPVTIGYGGEEPVTIGEGYGEGQEPVEVTTGFTGEQPMEVTGYGEGSEATNEVWVTQEPANTGPAVFERPPEKCFPKKKFCKCRSSTSGPTFGPSGAPIVQTTLGPRPTDRPTGGPGTSPSGGSPTGPGPVPTGEMGLIPHLLSSVNPPTTSPSSLAPGETTPPTGPTGEIPYLLGSSTTPAPLTSQLPYLLTRSTTGSPTMHMGSVPYLLIKTTPSTMTSTMSTTTFEGMMPYKLVRSTTPTTVGPTNVKKMI